MRWWSGGGKCTWGPLSDPHPSIWTWVLLLIDVQLAKQKYILTLDNFTNNERNLFYTTKNYMQQHECNTLSHFI
jgi:hypothetical protein